MQENETLDAGHRIINALFFALVALLISLPMIIWMQG